MSRAAWRRTLGVGLEIVVPIAILVVWGVWSARADSFFFPPLTEILQAFADTWIFERVSTDVLPSLERMAAGYAIAIVVAVAVGVPLALNDGLRRATSPIIEFLRAIPPPVLIPVAMVLIGVNDQMKIFIIAFVCVWPVLLNTIDGITGMDPMLDDVARVYGVPRATRIRRIVLPAASPQIFAGMRTSLSLALILMVISEMVASSNGIGFFILEAQRTFAITEMWSGMLLLGLLGYALNLAFLLVERRVLAWHRGAHADATG